VISDEVYRKIRLSRSDIVRKKSGSTGSSGETSGESQKSQEQPPSEASTESAQEAEKAGEGASMSGVKTEEQASEVQSGQGTSPAPPGN